MPRFTARTLIACVALAGVLYTLWFAVFWKGLEKDRARDCCVNQNLIDKYVGFWEARHTDLAAASGSATLDLDTAGTVAAATPGSPLAAGSTEIAKLAMDPEAFVCPEAGSMVGLRAVHYRWFSGAEPLRELNGRRRGAACLLHGERGPGGDLETRHAY